MNNNARTPEEYLSLIPEDRKHAIEKLRKVIKANLPAGIEETISYGMIGFVVPHSIYPKGYHVNPAQPLPLLSIASQKNHIAVYHMGISAFKETMAWFTEEYSKRSKAKLDMGKGCIRFRKPDAIPFDLIGELCSKISIEEYIKMYESATTLKSD